MRMMEMEERRLTMRLRKYWDLMRKAQPLPDYSQFNSGTIGDVWQYCFVVSVDSAGQISADGNHSYKYEYIGQPIIGMYGKDMTGQTLTQGVKHFMGGNVYNKLQEVVEKSVPIEDTGHIVNQQGKMLKYRACYLPFGKGAGNLTHIVGGLTYRVF
jgi:hypothetical protein